MRTEADVCGWYWLRSELVEIARANGIATAGSKRALSARIADTLAGRTVTPPARPPRVPQLSGGLTDTTLIPPGQRCTEPLRAYFVSRLGRAFRFDAEMRAFVGRGGASLEDACRHWRATRGSEPRAIDHQFEYNRFTHDWTAAHPHGRRDELLAAWWAHRSSLRPITQDTPTGRSPQEAQLSQDPHPRHP